MNLKTILEAILFVSSKPISFSLIAKRLPEFDPQDIKQALDELVKEYKENGRPIEIVEVATGYHMRTKKTYATYIERFVKKREPILTKSMLETLAIVAYKQPITKKEIDRLRGVDSSRALKGLLEKGFIRVSGKNKALSSTVFETTEIFLESFGLKSLSDLPGVSEAEELGLGSIRGCNDGYI
ncbi:MAG: SMC-Scp complex subunit ScpB [Desulfobacterota bacterium]|nr:SMC-Scp complex subunit ScpB [Thermodesulfobacteriota bacterium]MDW8001508.1 SMC-Scp complex subunit ScpB [Deltaproteobacteria bacterium]